jgi:hypothetical protein
MLHITDQQLQLLSATMEQGFRRRLLQHIKRTHPQKCQGRDDTTLMGYIGVMVDFARSVRIEREPTLRRLVDLQMKHGFHPRLNPTLRLPLEQFGLDEALRLQNFGRALVDPKPLTVITLDTPISPAGALNG